MNLILIEATGALPSFCFINSLIFWLSPGPQRKNVCVHCGSSKVYNRSQHRVGHWMSDSLGLGSLHPLLFKKALNPTTVLEPGV